MCILPCAIELWVIFNFSFVFMNFQIFNTSHTYKSQTAHYPLEMQDYCCQDCTTLHFFSRILSTEYVNTHLSSFSCSLLQTGPSQFFVSWKENSGSKKACYFPFDFCFSQNLSCHSSVQSLSCVRLFVTP